MTAGIQKYQLPVSQGTFIFHHFPQLDGLRGAAILLVISGHVLYFSFGFNHAGRLGGLGVLIFFVLSGFLITGLLDREVLQTGHVSLSSFYLRRILRLFPALFFFLGVLCLLIKFGVVKDTSWYTVGACLFYVRNMWGRGSSSGHIWSLSIEEQFYMLWPWVMFVFNRIAALRIALVGVVAVTVFRMTAIHLKWFGTEGGIYERPWFRFDSILIGCAVALVLCQSVGLSRFRAWLSVSHLPIPLWLGALAWTMWGDAASHAWYLTVQMIFATLILLNLLLARDSTYLWALSHPMARWFGRISYSWYLWQQLFTVPGILPKLGVRSFPFNVAASLLLAVLSSRLIERPFLQVKNRVSKYRETLPVSAGDGLLLTGERCGPSKQVRAT